MTIRFTPAYRFYILLIFSAFLCLKGFGSPVIPLINPDSLFKEEHNLTCTPPTGLTEIRQSFQSIILNWTFEFGSLYTIQLKSGPESGWTDVQTNYFGSSYTLYPLTFGQTYSWRLKRTCTDGSSSDWSPERTFTLSCFVPSVTLEFINNGSTFIRSAAQDDLPVTYTYRWRLAGTEAWNYRTNVYMRDYVETPLVKGGNYEWQVRSECPDGSSSAFSPTNVSQVGHLSIIKLTEVYVGSTSVQVNWNYSYGNFILQWRKKGDYSWLSRTETTYDDGDFFPKQIGGLEPGTEYEWRVQQQLYYGLVANSEIRAFITHCTPPFILKYARYELKASSQSAQVFWGSIPGTLAYTGSAFYQVRWRSSTEITWHESESLSQNTYTIQKLAPDTQYEWQVRQYCSPTEISDYSPPQYFITECPTASYLSASNLKGTSAELGWYTKCTDDYDFEWRMKGENSWKSKKIPASSYPGYTLTGLRKNTEYECRLHFYCKTDSYSTIYSFKTLNTVTCSIVSDTYLVILPPDSVRLMWSVRNWPDEKLFRLKWKEVGSANWSVIDTLNTTSYTLTNLDFRKQYEWELESICEGQTSSFSPQPGTRFFPGVSPCPSSQLRIRLTGDRSQLIYIECNTLFKNAENEVQIRASDTTSWTSIKGIPFGSIYAITNLRPGTVYQIRYRPFCSDQFSVIQSFTTSASSCDIHEPNNTVQDATLITGTSIKSTTLCLNDGMDNDWCVWHYNGTRYYILVKPASMYYGTGSYRFYLDVANDVLRVRTVPVDSAYSEKTDTFLQIYAEDGQTLLAENDDFDQYYSEITLYLAKPFATVRPGRWSDPVIWSAFRVPVAIDPVLIRHPVKIPGRTTGNTSGISYDTGGSLQLEGGAKLKITP